MKKKLKLVFLILLLTGCDVTYNLEISSKGYFENIDIISNRNSDIIEYTIPAYFGDIEYEDVNANYFEKIDGIEYYNSKVSKEGEFTKINYNYKFDVNTFSRSNFLSSSYNTIIFKKYDYNNESDDSEQEYMLFTTDDNFIIFDKFAQIENVKVNITCHYEVISSNADEVNENVYTWYLTKDNLKSINMVYNPDKEIDYRTLWQKIMSGDYFNITIFFVLIFLAIFIMYKFFKNYSDKQNAI